MPATSPRSSRWLAPLVVGVVGVAALGLAGCSSAQVLSGTQGSPVFLDAGHLLTLRCDQEGGQVQVHALRAGGSLEERQAWPLGAGPAYLEFVPAEAPGQGLIRLSAGVTTTAWSWPGGGELLRSSEPLFGLDSAGRLGLRATNSAYYEVLELGTNRVVWTGAFRLGDRPLTPPREASAVEQLARSSGAERVADFLGWFARTLEAEDAPPVVQEARFTPSGHVLYRAAGALYASAVSLKDVKLGRGARGTAERDLLLGRTWEVTCAAAGGRVYVHEEGLVRAYDLATQTKVWEARVGGPRPEGDAPSQGWIALSPDGSKLASLWLDAPVTVLSSESGEVLYRAPSPGSLLALSDEHLAWCDSASGSLQVVSLEDSSVRFRHELGPYASVQGLALSPDGRWLALQSQDETWVWELPAPSGRR